MSLPPFIAENVPLAPLTTFRAGGPARYFASPADAAEAAAAFAFAGRVSLPVLVLGGGSNILVPDAGVEAVVVRLSGAGEFGVIARESECVWRVGAAVPLASLAAETVRRGRAGLAEFAGIPGRVGGAAAMNAGPAGAGMGTFVTEADVLLPDGARRAAGAEELGFVYRGSELGAGKSAGLALFLRLRFACAEEPAVLAAAAEAALARKRATQPLSFPSAGCVFRNPPDSDLSAGALLDAAGCKGLREGGARVSGLHANFIVNAGGASSSDILLLAERMRGRVLEKFGVALSPELVLWGNKCV